PGRIDGLTVNAGQLYVLSGSQLLWQDGAVDLARFGADLVLQQPSQDDGAVAVASQAALLLIDQKGNVDAIKTGTSALPAAPVKMGHCIHAAWATAGGNYLLACHGAEPLVRELEQISQTSNLVFRVNHDLVVLNDVADGRLWLPQQDGLVRTVNWHQIEPEAADQATGQPRGIDQDQRVDCDLDPGPPRANDDHYGQRAGTTQVLMVLSNDVAGDCVALSITQIGAIDRKYGQAQVVHQGRAIQLTTPAAATGSFSFTYTIVDGRGQNPPSTAQVTVQIVPSTQNSAPVAQRVGQLVMEEGSQANYQVLSNFIDPDGDPLFLHEATSTSGQPVVFQANGQLTVTGLGQASLRQIDVVVSDGQATTSGSVQIDLRPPGSLAPVADPVMVQGITGQPVQIPLFDSLRSFHAAPVTLSAVSSPVGSTVQFDPDSGIITFHATTAKTYLLDATLLAGTQVGRAVIRVDLTEPVPTDTGLVAVQDIAYLAGMAPVTIDPLANDVAPGGGVKMVTAVTVPPSLGVKVAVVDHQFLEIIPLRQASIGGQFGYTLVVDGQSAQGAVQIVPTPPMASQPPVPSPIAVTVRTGGVVSLPLLERTLHLSDQPLSLVRDLETSLRPDQGRLYLSEKGARYQAPSQPMTVSVPFQVVDQDGQKAGCLATIRVHQSQAANKLHPTPKDLTGRVLAGETTRLDIPLTGIDVDGDGVILQGLDSAPKLGRIIETGADYLVYEAFPGEQGTDSFTYAVEDWVGLRAVAQVRVAVAPRPANSGGVVARDDELEVRPSQHLEARVLSNDMDFDGGQLSLCGTPVVNDPTIEATYVGQRLVLTAPASEGRFQVEYTACNQAGGWDRALVRINVNQAAPFKPPTVGDFVIKPADTVNQASVRVNVMELADNPSGPLSDLALSLPTAGPELAQLEDAGTITVKLQDQPAMVFFQLTNTRPEALAANTYGYIAVPALGTFPPMLRP
ncbi:MAG: Ig-like domain-containing protein, partial [Micrococcales bacterium]|nr:Ig-like domain-containing protein [Micrococcales bacterium]